MTSANENNEKAAIIRTERGLSIAGTRITLYDVMDYLKVQYPPQLIREKLCLNDCQIEAALSYIEAHRAEVETEYQEVLQMAEDNRQYWEKRNHEHFFELSKKQTNSKQKSLHAKLQAWKERLKSEG